MLLLLSVSQNNVVFIGQKTAHGQQLSEFIDYLDPDKNRLASI